MNTYPPVTSLDQRGPARGIKSSTARGLFLVLLFATLVSCFTPPDPSVAFCTQHGGIYENRPIEDEDVVMGYCIFPDGTECRSGEFMRSECRADLAAVPVSPLRVWGSEGEIDPPKTLDELVSKAPLIFIGEVASIAQYDALVVYDSMGRVVEGVDAAGKPLPQVPITDFVLEVDEVIRDDGTIASGEPIILRMHGIATREMKAATRQNAYPFSYIGDEHLFLLTPNPDGETYGFYYGPWSRLLIDDENDDENVVYVSDGAQQYLYFGTPQELGPMTLDEFLEALNEE